MAKRKVISPQASTHLRTIEVDSETIPTVPGDIETAAHKRALQRAEQRKTFVSLSDRLAEDTLYFRNYKWDMFDRNFPNMEDALMRFTTKYYPYAKGGALFVDEPATDVWHKRCLEKKAVMKAKGYRYVIIKPEAQFNDLLEQMAEYEMPEVS